MIIFCMHLPLRQRQRSISANRCAFSAERNETSCEREIGAIIDIFAIRNDECVDRSGV